MPFFLVFFYLYPNRPIYGRSKSQREAPLSQAAHMVTRAPLGRAVHTPSEAPIARAAHNHSEAPLPQAVHYASL